MAMVVLVLRVWVLGEKKDVGGAGVVVVVWAVLMEPEGGGVCRYAACGLVCKPAFFFFFYCEEGRREKR